MNFVCIFDVSIYICNVCRCVTVAACSNRRLVVSAACTYCGNMEIVCLVQTLQLQSPILEMRLSHTPYICSFRHYTPAGCCSCVPPPAIFHVHICISPTLMTFIGNRKGANIHQCRAINSSNAHIHKSACKATISHPFVHIIFNANGK